jgi:hemerythrin
MMGKPKMLIDKDQLPLVAMEFMNEVHLEDVDIINALYELIEEYEVQPSQSTKEQINTKFIEWFEHTVLHFKGEEDLMLEKGFPPYPVHQGEHTNGLAQMERIFDHWKAHGDIQTLKVYFTQEMLPWLINHIQTMDTVTANFFKSGASPCSI